MMSDRLQNLAPFFKCSNGEPNLTHFCSGSIVMLCRNPTLNPGFYFDKTFEEYKKGFHANGISLIALASYLVAGEGWFGLEKLHKLTADTKGSYRLKVTLTSREWKEYVGYWDWLKVITAFTRMQLLELCPRD